MNAQALNETIEVHFKEFFFAKTSFNRFLFDKSFPDFRETAPTLLGQIQINFL